MDNGYIYSFHGSSSSRWRTTDEFQEEDVWRSSLRTAINHSDSDPRRSPDPSIISKRLPTASRMIPKSGSGKSQDSRTVHQSSAPVNIPDWSKIYRTTENSLSDEDGNGNGIPRSSWESDDDDDEEGNVIPPHEWLVRKLARSQISSFSVCEGAGRTLKGRDLSRVRNDVLTKTGFLEPPNF